MKLNGYMELFNGYWINGSYEKAYDALYEAGKFVNLSSATVEIEPMMNGIAVHIQNFNNPHKTSFSNIEGYPSIPTNNRFLRDDKTFAEIALRHSQLILPNEDVNVQHLTNAEKTQGALATGVTAFPTVKDGISRIDRLLVDYTIPLDTPSITFDRDKYGVLFSSFEHCPKYISIPHIS